MSDSVGSVSVTVVPDARGWSEKLRAQIRDQVVKVKADADTTEANAELDKTARTRTAKVKVNVDKNPLEQGASKLDSFVGKLSILPALAIAGSAALVPLGAALGGVVAALAAPLAIAGGGATLFGVLAGFAVKDTEKQLKAIDSLQKKLDGLTKGTKDYADVQKQLRDAQKSLSPAQTAFSNAQGGLAASFQNFIGGKAGTALLGPLTQGMKLLAQILPSLTPVLVAAGDAFSNLLGDLGKAASGPGFDKFIHLVSGQVGHDIEGFGRVLGNIGKGLGGLFVVLDKSVGGNMVDTLVRLSGAFSDWANSKSGRDGVQSFLDYSHKVGPQVGRTIGAVARALGHVVEALAPLGPPTLAVISGIADAISAIPIPVLTALAGAFVGMVAFQKVGGFKGLALLGKLGGISGGKGGVVGSVLGGGVQKVFVVNMAERGLGGGTPTPGGGGKGALPVAAVAAGLSAFPSAAEVLATGGALAKFGAKLARFGEFVGAPAFLSTQPNTGTHPVKGGTAPNFGTQFTIPPSGKLPTSIPTGPVRAASTAVDALAAKLARASHGFDLIGHSAAANSARATSSLSTVKRGLDAIPANKKLVINAYTGQASFELRSIQSLIAGIDRVVNVHINVTKSTNATLADVNTPKHALGGYIAGRGSGTSDSIPSWLSNGEYVVNANATAHNRALLEQLNSGRRPTYTPAPSGGRSGGGSMFPSHMTLVVEDGTQLRAYVADVANGEYGANAAYDAARAGR